MKRFAVLVVVAVVALVVPGLARAGTQDFTLVNKTGVEINNLYVSPGDEESWEEDVLGADTLPDGESVTITFSDREECLWDLMVTDEDGNGVTWSQVNLCQVSRVVLHYDGEKAWATFD